MKRGRKESIVGGGGGEKKKKRVLHLLQHVFGEVLLFIHGQYGSLDFFIREFQPEGHNTSVRSDTTRRSVTFDLSMFLTDLERRMLQF